ncbi:hypothetical protein QBC45DRAFT_433045 [Copromyces sp. CBS 386.78]|nr:hypothetical protein QBC45DRAFT_433045 [Copromyces sp. CBS 386.78]
MHPTTVLSPLVLVMAGLTVAGKTCTKHPKEHKDHGASDSHCGEGCHDFYSRLSKRPATVTYPPVSATKADAIPVTLTARAMATSVPDGQMKLAAPSADDDYKVHLKEEACPSDNTGCSTILEATTGPIHALEKCVDHPYFSAIFGNTTSPGIKGQKEGHKCAWEVYGEWEACPSNHTTCFRAENRDVYYSPDGCDKEPDFIEIFRLDRISHIPSTVNQASSAKAAVSPVTLQARAMATPNAWERPETAVLEIDPRTEAITTTTTMEPETSTTTVEIEVMSVITIPDMTSTIRTRNSSRRSSTPSVASTAQPTVTAVVVVVDPQSTTTVVVEPQSTTTVVVFAPQTTATEVVLAPETTATAAPRPITTAVPRPITTAAPRPIKSTTPVPHGAPITTISNIMPGRNTVQLPSQSEAPVIVINAPEESYSTVRTTETLWSSVWQPINIAISTRTRDLRVVVPPTQAPGSSGKSSGASTTRSGAGVIVMAGIGALAACFMMF